MLLSNSIYLVLSMPFYFVLITYTCISVTHVIVGFTTTYAISAYHH